MVGRGKVVVLNLAQEIIFNEQVYTKASIEIDHINYGLDSNTKELKKTKRYNFTEEDICQFIMCLDGIEINPAKVFDVFRYFSLELLCPVIGTHFDKKFRIVFMTTMDDPGSIGTITLYRVKY